MLLSVATSRDDRREGVVNPAVARQHVGEAGTEVERPAVEVVDAPAGLGDQQRAGTDIPGVRRVRFEEGVDAAGRDVGEAERRRAQATHGPAVAAQLDDALSERRDRRWVVGLNPGAHERLIERFGSGYPQAVGTDPGSSGAHSREHLLTERLEDRPGDDAGIVADGDRRAGQGHAVGEVRRPVEWVDEPGERAAFGPAAALLAEDRVLREMSGDHPLDLRLGGEVDIGDHRRPFVLVGNLRRPAELFDEDNSSGTRRGGGDGEQFRRCWCGHFVQGDVGCRVLIRPGTATGSGMPSPKRW